MAYSRESLICPLCLDIFKTLKLLPCFHTFCEHCLNDLTTQHPDGIFPCPSCRTRTTVLPGGVSAFQTNFYFKSEDLERARSDIMCLQHPNQDRDLFCVQCDLPICFKCKLTKHEDHKTQDLKDAAPAARDQLDENKSRLERCVRDVIKHVELATQEQQAVKDKHAALVTNIRNRQATLKAAVDKYTDDALTSLDKVTGDITNTLQADLHCLQQNLQELTELQQQVQQALDTGVDFNLVTVAKELRCGNGSMEAAKKLAAKQITTIRRPVLRSSTTPDTTLKSIRAYMGSAAKMEMKMPEREETMEERFRCREDPDTDVCHVCPMNDDVWISYEPYILRNDASSEQFNAACKVVNTIKYDTPGRNTMVKKTNNTAIYMEPTPGSVVTYAKKYNAYMIRYFRLDNNLSGEGTVNTITVVSEDPWKTEDKKVITLNCAAHRAFDVNSDEQLFVVLEEGKAPDFQRRVQLYRHNVPNAITTYKPPVKPFQPSDVCFHKKNDYEVLLVADEMNDAIHVVYVTYNNSLMFERYLSPGCPLLVQPTALNMGTEHRLWIACRGGRILTCTPNIPRRPSGLFDRLKMKFKGIW